VRKKLQDYLPPILLKTYEFPLLCETEQPEIDRLRDAADAVLDAQFISTAGETAIARYERIFGITPMDTDTLAERRFKVLAKINAQLPFSVRRLRQQLATLCGEDGYKLEVSGGKYTSGCKLIINGNNIAYLQTGQSEAHMRFIVGTCADFRSQRTRLLIRIIGTADNCNTCSITIMVMPFCQAQRTQQNIIPCAADQSSPFFDCISRTVN
jgi:hypothetical protein